MKTKDRLRSKVWWPNMNSMVERHRKKCLGCQAVTPVAIIPTVKTTTIPTKPWRDLAVDLTGPLPTGESLLVTVDYYSRWIEVDVVRNTTSTAIIRCLENHFTRHGIPETLRTDNGPNLVSHEMEGFLDELGIKHRKTIPLWPRVNREVERQNKSLLKATCAAQAEGKPWQQKLQKYLLAYRSTPHFTTGVSPAELLYRRKIRTKMPEFEGGEEEEKSGITDQQARDQDAEKKSEGLKLQIGEQRSQRWQKLSGTGLADASAILFRLSTPRFHKKWSKQTAVCLDAQIIEGIHLQRSSTHFQVIK